MHTTTFNNYNFLKSRFTRKKGFTNIDSSFSLSRKKAISILNSFAPQGASPKSCIRIGSHKNIIGVGYYYMEDNSNAKLFTFLKNVEEFNFETFKPPIALNDIYKISNGETTINFDKSYSKDQLFNLSNKFEKEGASSILYSLLSGDNIIIVDPSHEERLKFIATMLSILPVIGIKYNRFTSGCYELEGNENIIGVPELPIKFRSHKKLYLPLDTIFIDLKNNSVEGNGIKNSSFTRKLIDLTDSNVDLLKYNIVEFFRNIIDKSYRDNYKENTTESLIHRIEVKLGLKKEINANWIMDF